MAGVRKKGPTVSAHLSPPILVLPQTLVGSMPPHKGSICAYSFLTTTFIFQGKLDTLCDFVQHCDQMPLMWCPTRNMVSRAQGYSPWAGILFLSLTFAP